MNYFKIYNSIVERRLSVPVIGYSEKHHIIPVSLGGSNSSDNLVRLSAREHFICHWLLLKMYKNDTKNYFKMVKAFNMMCNAHTENHDRYVANSRIFSRYREDFSEAMRVLQSGDGNSQKGTMWICNLETKENKKVSDGVVPEGWVLGRNKWVLPYKRKSRAKTGQRQKLYANGYRVSVGGVEYESISQAADVIGIGHETARMRFKNENYPEYIIVSR